MVEAGDGWITYHSNKKIQATQVGFVFGHNDAAIAEWVQERVQLRTSPRPPALKHRPERGVSELATTNHAFVDYFITRLGAISKRSGVPRTVLQGSRDFQRGYLRGLFSADAHVEVAKPRQSSFNGTKRIRLISAHSALAGDVQLLLSTFGIRSRRRYEVQEARGQSYDRWVLDLGGSNVDRFAERIGFMPGSAKTVAVENVLDKSWRTISDRTSARVVAVEPLNVVEDVFNLTVDHPLHQFAVNGLISANCGEIVLRKNELCNLTIAVARSGDTLESMKEKVEIATIIGTIQSLATNFPDLRPVWRENCIQERLLGVDITGQMDSSVVHDASVMQALRAHAVETNRAFAERLGINQSAAVTTVKPSGNSSQLLNCSIRTARALGAILRAQRPGRHDESDLQGAA